jgi:hypothetical protein
MDRRLVASVVGRETVVVVNAFCWRPTIKSLATIEPEPGFPGVIFATIVTRAPAGYSGCSRYSGAQTQPLTAE